MTQEQIHTAAEEYAASFAQSDERKRYCAEDFAAGAKWRIESVWHDGSETPKFGCPILGITIFGEAIIDGPFGIEYDVNIDMSNIKKWAYLNDLVPDE